MLHSNHSKLWAFPVLSEKKYQNNFMHAEYSIYSTFIYTHVYKTYSSRNALNHNYEQYLYSTDNKDIFTYIFLKYKEKVMLLVK